MDARRLLALAAALLAVTQSLAADPPAGDIRDLCPGGRAVFYLCPIPGTHVW